MVGKGPLTSKDKPWLNMCDEVATKVAEAKKQFREVRLMPGWHMS